jgi:hypothetical protein
MKSTRSSRAGESPAHVVRFLTAALKELREALPTRTVLSRAERKRAHHMGARSVFFLVNSLQVAREHPRLLPPAFDLDAFERGVSELAELHEFSREVQRLGAEVRDTLMKLSQYLLPRGRLVRHFVRSASQRSPGLTHVVARLKTRGPYLVHRTLDRARRSKPPTGNSPPAKPRPNQRSQGTEPPR